MTSEILNIKDKHDTAAAEHLVVIGYPENKEHLVDLIFWSCFPNDPVCRISHPYIQSLRNDILARPMAEFLAFHLGAGQTELISDAFDLFINPRGEEFRSMVLAATNDAAVQKLFETEEYSFEGHHIETKKEEA